MPFLAIAYLDRFVLESEVPGAQYLMRVALEADRPLASLLGASRRKVASFSSVGLLARGLGFLLAKEAGFEKLARLSLRAQEEGRSRVPDEWIFEAARFDPSTQDDLEGALLRLAGEDEGGVFKVVWHESEADDP